jgi:hypothetical protein
MIVAPSADLDLAVADVVRAHRETLPRLMAAGATH